MMHITPGQNKHNCQLCRKKNGLVDASERSTEKMYLLIINLASVTNLVEHKRD